MIRNMVKTYMTRLFTVLMLTMVSTGAWADVEVLFGEKGEKEFSGSGGKVSVLLQTEEDDGSTTVYISVYPSEGYSIKMEDITVVAVRPVGGESNTRTPEIAQDLTLSGTKDAVSYPNYAVYSFNVPSGLNAWVQKTEFRSKRRDAKGGGTLTYHIINLGRLNNDGTLGSERTEALTFTTSSDEKVAVPDKYKSPLAKNWNYYSSRDVTFNQTSRVCTFNSDPSLSVGETLAGDADIYVTYELDETKLSTIGLSDGDIYNIKLSGNRYLYQNEWQGDPNTATETTANPKTAKYLWKFNIVDPYQITIQSKSTAYFNYFLSAKAGGLGDIRLRNPLSTAKNNKVWAFGLLNGNAENTYQLIVADGYKMPANADGRDQFGHGYLNNNDNGKSRYQAYGGNDYKNCDLVFEAVTNAYTYSVVDRSGRVAIKYHVTQQAGSKLDGYSDIPEAIRSPYIAGESVKFYSFSGDYSQDNLIDDNQITETPLADANIYVVYTTDHLADKFLNLHGTAVYNIKVNDHYIYDDNGTLAHESSAGNVSTDNRMWYLAGSDPYAIQIKNADSNLFLTYTTPSTLSLANASDNKYFILMAGSANDEGNPKTYEQMELMAATGGSDYYRIGRPDGMNISTTATGDASLQVQAHTVNLSTKYYLIDKAGRLIEGDISSSSSDLELPSEWVSPLVSEYHYFKTSGYNESTDTYAPTNEISSPLDAGDDKKIYVTYNVGNSIDLTGGKTYLLKFLNGVSFNQENGSDGIEETATKAIYPYNNGDFNLYVYGQAQWDKQLASGASTRTRWLWKIVSSKDGNLLTGDAIDPYHVIIKSEQNQKIKISNTEEYEGKSYLRTYKPNDEVGVVTSVAYENSGYYTNEKEPKMTASIVNGEPTEYMLLGTSLDNMTLKTFGVIGDDRQIVNKFEQYWKNNPTVHNLVGDNPAANNAMLTGMEWHQYKAWAFAAEWGGNAKEKSIKEDDHWFQTIDMGDGKFTLEAVDLAPQVILLDQHGWEIMRTPMYTDADFTVVNTDGLRKFNSPMVEEYHWYPKAVKSTGYHKYTISNPEPTIDVYMKGENPNNNNIVEWYCYKSEPFSSSSLAVTPDGNLDGYANQDKKYKTDFYVTYDVKSDYAKTYTGAALEEETTASPFLLKQGDIYAKSDGTATILTTTEAPASVDDAEDDIQWYLKPNFNIDREMGYKYAGETGAQSEAKTKAATDAENYDEGRNGFDPYNLQIQNKAYTQRYFTANTTGSALSGGAWTGTSSSVSLQNMTTTSRQTATGYDQTTLNITNATFMVVDDGNGNLQLMPRFDHQKVVTSFTALEPSGSANQSITLSLRPKVIHSSTEFTDLGGYYILAPDFTFTSTFTSLGTDDEHAFTGTIDGQLNPLSGLSVPLVAYAKNATIKNVILENIKINSGNTEGDAGAICCNAAGASRIYNCGVLGEITETKDNDGNITSVTGTSQISGTNNVGGIVGKLVGSSRVINCYSYAVITGGAIVAGVVGNIATDAINQGNVGDVGMVVNCMFYGDITGGNKKYPVYGGPSDDFMIKNDATNGVNPYNYFRGNATFDDSYGNIKYYKRSWPADEEYLTRFEYYRSILNSNRQLCTYWVTDKAVSNQTAADTALIAKWVLDPSIAPYPILKKWGKYPSIINPDPDRTWDPEANNGKGDWQARSTAEPYHGKSFTQKLSVTVNPGGHAASGVVSKTISLTITDMDILNHDYGYYKVQLPYYNELFGDPTVQIPATTAEDYNTKWDKRYGGNYKGYVVTGWKITDIPGGVANVTNSTGTDANGVAFDHTFTPNWESGYNYADRYCTTKDKYSPTNPRVFAQGGFFYVPEGVTSITIEAYWGKAVYLHNKGHNLDRVNITASSGNRTVGNPFEPAGTLSTTFQEQTVYDEWHTAVTNLDAATKTGSGADEKLSLSVYDQAIVLLSNYQLRNENGAIGTNIDSKWHPYTIMSIDQDLDNEPDYCFEFQYRKDYNRDGIQPIRFDFLPVPELGLAVRHDVNQNTIGIFVPQGHFEITETSFMHTTQFEYDGNKNKNTLTKVPAPIILNGGHFEQVIVRYPPFNNIQYFLMGGHFRMLRFTPGAHANDDAKSTVVRLCAVNCIGGEYPEFYLSGIYNTGVNPTLAVQGNPHCYTNGGRFGMIAGAGYEKVMGDVTFKVDHSIIDEFYGGGINGSKPVQGSIDVTIDHSKVTKFCGGPKVGVMNDGKTVTTHATGTIFTQYYGGGNGGTSYFREKRQDGNVEFTNPSTEAYWNKYGYNIFNPLNTISGVGNAYQGSGDNKGYHALFEFECFVESNGIATKPTIRSYLNWAQFGKTSTGDITNFLDDCIIEENFYGGGNLGNVNGSVTSNLKDCTVKGNVFGGGYSGKIEPFRIHDKSKTKYPYIDKAGVMQNANGVFDYVKNADGTDRYYTWCYRKSATEFFPEGVVIPSDASTTTNLKATFEYPVGSNKWYVLTTESLEGLGAVEGNITLTISGTTEVRGNVYGGGNESIVKGNTNVNICAVQDTNDPTKYSPVDGTPVITGDVFGGGKGLTDSFKCDKAMVGVNGDNNGSVNITAESVNKGTKVIIGNGTVNGTVYGGGEVGRVEWNTVVKVGLPTGTSAPVIKKDVFGAGKGVEQYGYAALVRGNTFVTIQGDAKVGLSVYGGGEIASVGKYNITTEADMNDEDFVAAHPELEVGMPWSLANNGTGYCNVTIQGNAEIGPDNMKMTSPGGPDDAGHVFGAGKGILPYENEDDFDCQLTDPSHAGKKHPGRMAPGDVWECYEGKEAKYLSFIETQALATQTYVTIDGNAFVKGSVYGGSMNGHVQHDTQVTINGGQIGCGKNTTERYQNDVWGNNYTVTGDLECDSWPFEGEHLPYDIYKDSDGDGTPDFATDGHTFYGNVFGGGSGYYPYKRNPNFTNAMAEQGYGDGLWHREAGSVGGNTVVNITGGHILTSVYGGNEQTDVGTYVEDEDGVRTVWSGGKCTINMTGGTVGVPRTHEQMRNHPVTCYVFGAGKGDQRINFNTWTNVGSTEVNISGDARIYGSTFGGGEDGHVIGNAKTNIGGDVTITKADGTTEVKNYSNVIIGTRGTSGVDGNIFGGGRGFSETALTAGVVGGNVEVNISNGIMLGSVFGGGRLASVGTYFANANDERYGKMQADTETETHGHITVNISGGSIGAVDNGVLRNSNFTIGDVFGGSKGTSADPRFGLAKNTTTTISGNAQINRSVFGGGEAGNVQGTVIVNIEGNSTIGEDVYGGGALADSNTANWNATLNDGAGGWAEGMYNATTGKTTNTTTVNLTGGSIGGDAYGGGLGQKTGFNGGASDIEATVYGDITVNLGTTGTPANGDNPAVPGTATAFNISFDNSGTAEAPVQVIKSGRVFGTNNLNGSPKGNVTVNVYKTVKGNVDRTEEDPDNTKQANRNATDHTYQVAAVYGGGNLADYATAGKKATVIIHTCDVSVQDVYGGGNAAKVSETDVLVKGAWEIDHVFGGGNGKDKYKKGNEWITNAGADVLGNATTLLTGGYIHEAYGGSNEKGTIEGDILFNTNAEDPTCDCALDLRKIVGSGKNAEVWGDIITVLGCQPEAPVDEYIGGADNADVHGNVELTITSGTFGKVFGGNNIGGVIEGHIKVNIEETGCRPIVIGELYGCGNDAAYSVYGYNADGTCKTEGTKIYADPEVNVISCTSIGKVFGGGLGEHATVYGNPTVNINQIYGKAYSDANKTKYDAVATSLGEIGDVFGGGNEANVVGNTHVNIGTVPKVTLTSVHDNASTEIKENEANVIGANITGNVYGGGNKANVSGNTNVVIGKDGTTTTTP
ncbi:MAG: hypothetical protein IJQ60_15790 [Prevotella sp.]|nr:hypothetical protein [Prevotella sp.]